MAMEKLTRRSFVAGSSGAVAAAAALGALPASAEEAGAGAAAQEGLTAETAAGKWAFEIAPAPIADEDISRTVSAEIVVVGCGLSGVVTAVAAAEQGADVVIVTASSKPISRGGSNFGLNTTVQQQFGIELSDDDIRRHIHTEQQLQSMLIDGRKWAYFFNNSTESMNWEIEKLTARGLQVSLEPGYTDPMGVLTMPACSHNFFTEEQPWGFMTGAPLQAENFAAIFTDDLGGTIYYNMPVRQLVRGGVANGTEGAVEGCIAQDADGSYVKFEASKAVVLATGDFSLDRDMMAKYAPWAAKKFEKELTYGDVDYDVEASWSGLYPGDGHKMALWVGAAWQKTPIAPMICNGVAGPCKQGPMGNFWGLNMNIKGRRFMNEVQNFAYSGVAITQQPKQIAFGIWDSQYAYTQDSWDYYGCVVGQVNGSVPYTPEELTATFEDSYLKADTIEELVDMLVDYGLEDTEAALKTIADYNAYAEAGHDDEFNVDPSVLYPIATPPFYAGVSNNSQFLTVCGGIRTNSEMQALDEDDVEIEGLYTTGIMTGDFYANTYNFVLPGLNLGGVCGTLSYLLGRRLAAL